MARPPYPRESPTGPDEVFAGPPEQLLPRLVLAIALDPLPSSPLAARRPAFLPRKSLPTPLAHRAVGPSQPDEQERG